MSFMILNGADQTLSPSSRVPSPLLPASFRAVEMHPAGIDGKPVFGREAACMHLRATGESPVARVTFYNSDMGRAKTDNGPTSPHP
jgi:hypothetical protein